MSTTSTESPRAQIGVTGLAVMGSNIARNFARHGHTVALHNRSIAKTDALIAEHGSEGDFVRTETVEEFVAALQKPRRVLIMVKAGAPTDAVIEELANAMEPGDIIIDGGNSLYTDTIRREAAIRARGLHFVGAGISGGEEGALNGPSIMPGGPKESYEALGPLLESISAHVDGTPCCTHIGPDGSGHFVKMVHNGIEYADMQLIGEAYNPLPRRSGLRRRSGCRRLHRVEQGHPRVLPDRDHRRGAPPGRRRDGQAVGRRHRRRCRAEGNGAAGRSSLLWIWACRSPVSPKPCLLAHCPVAAISALQLRRRVWLPALSATSLLTPEQFAADIQAALYASKIVAYAQGFDQIAAGSAEYDWNLKPADLATIWRGGCIIRAQFLNRIKDAFDADPSLPSLILAPYFREAIEAGIDSWRRVVATATMLGIPVPAFASSLSYYDGLRAERLPAALTQGQRDFFGAHTYERIDKPGKFHTLWSGDRSEIEA